MKLETKISFLAFFVGVIGISLSILILIILYN